MWGKAARARIAEQVDYIRHWTIYNKSYEEAEDTEATWFVDPPYSGECGRIYPHNSLDYKNLANWCRARNGQVIVAEQSGATWLPFQSFGTVRGTFTEEGQKYSEEVIWCSDWQ